MSATCRCNECGGELTFPCPCMNFMCFFRRNNEAVCLSCLPVPDSPVEHYPPLEDDTARSTP